MIAVERAGRSETALARVELGGETLWTVRNGDRYSRLGLTLAGLLGLPHDEARRVVDAAADGQDAAAVIPDRILAPIDPQQEVWAAGVTYLRSRDGRIEEATDGSPYDRVYAAERPELFFKSLGWRTVGPGDSIGVRSDSPWNAPEPELGLVLDCGGTLFGYVTGNDASSRSIEGENLLYLPQAKIYTASCALGPEIVPAWSAEAPFEVALEIERDGRRVFAGSTSTDRMARSFGDLADWLFRGLRFPDGVIVLTGTGIVPDADFTLLPGDRVVVDIVGIGRLENDVALVGGAGPGSAA